jgi:thiol-disulfide isomerase/thioredoxin
VSGGRLVRATALAALVVAAAGCTSNSARSTAAGGQTAPATGGLCVGAPGAGPTLAPGAPASGSPALPDLTLPCLGGGDLALRRLTGTPVVLNLWASWCAPCRTELPALQRLHAAAGGRLRVVGVDTEDTRTGGESIVTDLFLTFPHLRDDSGELLRAIRRPGLPVTVLVSADGRVVRVYSGAPLTDASLRTLVREQLGVRVP